MASAVIICNGDFPKKEYPLYLIRTADYVICCDGAATAFMRNNVKIFGEERLPDAIIGDLDSLPKSMRGKYADIIVKVEEQDYNDLNKAFRYALMNYHDIDTIHILGAGGKREDHTVGNLSYLMEYAKELNGLKERELLAGVEIPYELNVDMISDWTTSFAICSSTSFFVGSGREISIFSPDNTLTIKSEGLKWQTSGVVFDNWWKATLNVADKDEVKLELSHPAPVLIILN